MDAYGRHGGAGQRRGRVPGVARGSLPLELRPAPRLELLRPSPHAALDDRAGTVSPRRHRARDSPGSTPICPGRLRALGAAGPPALRRQGSHVGRPLVRTAAGRIFNRRLGIPRRSLTFLLDADPFLRLAGPRPWPARLVAGCWSSARRRHALEIHGRVPGAVGFSVPPFLETRPALASQSLALLGRGLLLDSIRSRDLLELGPRMGFLPNAEHRALSGGQRSVQFLETADFRPRPNNGYLSCR